MTENDVPNYDLMGALANATTWCAVWFDLDLDGYADKGTLIVEPVACWASYAIRGKRKQVVVGGLVAGPSGLYLAEQEDDNFRGYIPVNTEDAVGMFVTSFNNAVMEEGGEDDETEDEEVEETEGEEVG